MKPDKLTWAVMLGLVSVSVSALEGCGKSNGVDPNGTGTGTVRSGGGGGSQTYPASHPCAQKGKGNCDFYLVLPDGGAITPPEGTDSTTDAGKLRICGPCNG